MNSGLAMLLGGASMLVALAISMILTPWVRNVALRRGFVDAPAGQAHKAHRRTVAFGGGIAIALAVTLPVLAVLFAAYLLHTDVDSPAGWLANKYPLWNAWLGGVQKKAISGLAILAGAVVLHLVGLQDDRKPISAMPKLAVQVAVALMLTVGFGIRIGEFLGAGWAILLTTLWIVTITNAFNFMDNMDGLSAGVGLLAAVVLAVSAFRAGQIFVPCMLMLVAGALLGFLIFNFPPASIFMGDAGSLVVGYLLAVLTVLVTFYDEKQGTTPFGVLVPVVVFAIPLYDLVSVTWRRYRSGRSIFSADRGHFSHRLVSLGMTPTSAVLTIYLATLATALPAMLLPQLDWAGAVLVLGQGVCVVAMIAILEARHER